MPAASSYDYAVIRVVPRVEREEFVNVGVILSCPARDYLGATIELDERRLLTLDPAVDLDVVRDNLEAIPKLCAGGPSLGPIGRLPARERFHWLVAPRSTVIQTSAVHTGCCEDPEEELRHLVETQVRLGG